MQCPKCKSEKILKIIYGLMVPEKSLVEMKEEGMFWGGCAPDKTKKCHCDSCQYEWGKVKNN